MYQHVQEIGCSRHVKIEQALQNTPNRLMYTRTGTSQKNTPNRLMCTGTSQKTRKKACHDAMSIASPK